MQGKLPRTVLSVRTDSVYYHCPKAFVRARLWSMEAQLPRSELPSMGSILEKLSKGSINAAEFDNAYPARLKTEIY